MTLVQLYQIMSVIGGIVCILIWAAYFREKKRTTQGSR